MILVADSGSTKTHWRLVDEQKNIHQYTTIGFSPFFIDTPGIIAELQTSLLPHLPLTFNHQPLTIYFYGAGCSSHANIEVVASALSASFPGAAVHVDHDLLGAARAVCGNNEGMAAILGTGSNSCYYNGKEIVKNVAALGFILGDEGSGAHLGKTLVQAFLNEELPPALSGKFSGQYKMGKAELLDAVYKKPFPNRFLASFSSFILKNMEDAWINAMVLDCFREFFDKHICKYPKHKESPLGCVGSIAFYYSKVLKQVAEEKGVKVGTIIESPVAALTLYHMNQA